MKDGLVPHPKLKGQFLKAGACLQQCRSNSWGERCENACGVHCKTMASGEPSCERGTGLCHACDHQRHWGPTCGKRCSGGCLGGMCEQETGRCIKGCKAGHWGPACEKNCPFHTGPEGCSRKDGLPVTCIQGYPSYQGDPPFEKWDFLEGTCRACPAGCGSKTCNPDGTCKGPCVTGFHGKRCEVECEQSCDGACDKATTGRPDGECQACKPGFTGPKCLSHCHKTCHSCKQSTATLASSKPAVGPRDCLSCHRKEPAELDRLGQCSCIDGAARLSGPVDDGVCHCTEPEDVKLEAFFAGPPEADVAGSLSMARSPKHCGKRCKVQFNGQTLKEIHKLGNDTAPPKCVAGRIIKAVIKAEGALEQGPCPSNHLKLPGIDDVDDQCLHQAYVNFILQE